MRLYDVIWKDKFVAKIAAKHNVTTDEVEEVLFSEPHVRLAERGRVKGEHLYVAYGRTTVGRYLVVFFVRKRRTAALPISASILRRQLRMTMEIECICQTSENLKSDTRLNLDAFRALRNQCAALREILVPQDILDQFERFASEPRDEARHASVILLALDRGCLSRITAPIHAFLLDGNTIRREVRSQYLSDLKEKWFLEEDTLERHKKSKIFLGRISELMFAYWLKSNGYDIKGLEATAPRDRAVCDVVASNPDGNIVSFESKYIGTEDLDFECIVQSLQGSKVVEFVSPYTAANYLLFQVFSAAKQVQGHAEDGSQKIVSIMISEMTWERFCIPLMGDWIDWTNPKFFPGDVKWKEFLAKQKQKNPQLEEELRPIIGNLDGIIFMCMNSDYEITLKKRVNLRR